MHGSMMSKTNMLLLSFVFAVVIVMAMVVYLGGDRFRVTSLEGVFTPSASCNSTAEDLRLSQIQLSRQLNQAKKEYGRLNCELNKLRHRQLVTDSGGWCKEDSSPSSKQHLTDHDLARHLSTFFKGKRVGSFGDGPGLYKKFFDSTGLLSVYEAYDGAPYCEEVTRGVVKFLDLTVPQYGLPVYDWVMSLEVAEHIPAMYEQVYIDNVVRHARDGILISWAVPGQGGHSHINNKAFKDVKVILERAGFKWDEYESKNIQSQAKLPWLKANVNVFRRILNSDLTLYA